MGSTSPTGLPIAACEILLRIKDEDGNIIPPGPLDDFGSGMSSFNYLKHFAVDFLKIDGMFAKDISVDSLNFSIIKAIHDVGHAIGLKTIVEGVEDLNLLPIFQSLGIEYAQGYGIQYPQPLEPLEFPQARPVSVAS
ncbi:MAG: EAL domain-containing protein [Prochlorotrichaceae cyanobacterium]